MQDKVYKCEKCNKIATEVHHKLEIKTVEGWEERLNYDGLMALCGRCHNKEHGRFTKTVRRKKY